MKPNPGTFIPTLGAMVIFLPGCALGIPSAADIKPPLPPEPCIWVTDGMHAACLTEDAYRRWLKRNGL